MSKQASVQRNAFRSAGNWLFFSALPLVSVVLWLVSAGYALTLVVIYFFGARDLSEGSYMLQGATVTIWGMALLIVLMGLGALSAPRDKVLSFNGLLLPGVVVLGAVLLFTNVPIAQLWDVALFVLSAGIGVGLFLHATRGAASNQSLRTKQPQGEAAQDEGANEEQSIQFPAEHTGKSFASVEGMSEVKKRLLEAGHEITGSQSPVGKDRNGMLLFGEPGNGKTHMAESLSGELGLPMVAVTFGKVNSKWIGQTTEQVKKAFDDAHAQAPCVLFLDEVDSLLKDRYASNSSNDEAAKTTNTLLTELVDARKSQIVVIAATNYLDKLDQAAIREGRFDFKIEITPPDEPARAALIRAAIKPYEKHWIKLYDDGVEIAARRWEGFSVARISAVADEAARYAKKSGELIVDYKTLGDALRTIQGRKGKLPRDTKALSELVLPKPMRRRLEGIATRMERIEKVEAQGGRVPTGLLFYGPPGTGKTAVARALAKSSGWAFLSVSGNDLLSDPDKIDELVCEARDIRPAIVFIDEADDVLADRRYARHTATITNRLLSAIDGAGGKVHDIVWVAATNHPDQLDSAALRGGRLATKIEFALPDEGTVAHFIKKWMDASKAQFHDDARPRHLAPELHGLSIANVMAILQEAVDRVVEQSMLDNTHNPAPVTRRDVIAARDSVARDFI